MEMETSTKYDTQTECCFLDLPWEDVVFKHIFCCLNLKVLFRLRRVSKRFMNCIDTYFTQCPLINLVQIGDDMTKESFAHCTHNNEGLKYLVIRNLKSWMKDAILVPALDVAHRLVYADLSNCSSLSNSSVQKLAISCPKLEVLILRECHWLSKEGCLVIAMNCRQLKRLDLAGCWLLDDEAIGFVSTLLENLQYLNISKIYSITDTCIVKLAKEVKCLSHLNITGCWRVTDQGISYLVEYCHSLKGLQAQSCRDITERSLAHLRLKGIRVDIPARHYSVDAQHANYLHRLNLQV